MVRTGVNVTGSLNTRGSLAGAEEDSGLVRSSAGNILPQTVVWFIKVQRHTLLTCGEARSPVVKSEGHTIWLPLVHTYKMKSKSAVVVQRSPNYPCIYPCIGRMSPGQ